MKQLILAALIAAATLTSCDHPPAGTKVQLHEKGAEIEVYKYFYDDAGNWVYVSRFIDQPNTATTTWLERQGKQWVKKKAVTVN